MTPGGADVARQLADQFEREAIAFLRQVEQLPAERWHVLVPEEERTVAALVNHVALGWRGETVAFHRIASGRAAPGMSTAALNALNAEHGDQYAQAGREETLVLLQKALGSTAAFIRSLSDEQLARRGYHMPEEPERSVAEWIEMCLIGHPAEHLPAILGFPRSSEGQC